MSSKQKKDSTRNTEYTLTRGEESSDYYLLIGKRYLRCAAAWLRRGGEHITVGRHPTEDCRLTFEQAVQVAEKFLAHRGVDAKDKKRLQLRHIRVHTFGFEPLEGEPS